jgi:hypothetical protein
VTVPGPGPARTRPGPATATQCGSQSLTVALRIRVGRSESESRSFRPGESRVTVPGATDGHGPSQLCLRGLGRRGRPLAGSVGCHKLIMINQLTEATSLGKGTAAGLGPRLPSPLCKPGRTELAAGGRRRRRGAGPGPAGQ